MHAMRELLDRVIRPSPARYLLCDSLELLDDSDDSLELDSFDELLDESSLRRLSKPSLRWSSSSSLWLTNPMLFLRDFVGPTVPPSFSSRVADDRAPMQHARMLVLDTEFLHARVVAQFGSVAAAVDRWAIGPAPNRSTLGRWLNGEDLPKSDAALLSFAATLDLDPLALLRLDAPTFRELCGWVARALEQPKSFLAPWSFAGALVRHSRDWPPESIARYFHRPWTTQPFAHTGERRNVYAALTLASSAANQVWHFAWRPDDSFPWRPYGFVRRRAATIALFQVTGITDEATCTNDSVIVETFFGGEDAEFLIASLHPFSWNFAEPGARRVRFGRRDV